MITTDARIDELLSRLKASGLGKSVSASEWQEVEDFLIENLITNERITKEYLCGKKHGIEEGMGRVRTALLDKAAKYFVEGKDREAEQLRSIANEIQKP